MGRGMKRLKNYLEQLIGAILVLTNIFQCERKFESTCHVTKAISVLLKIRVWATGKCKISNTIQTLLSHVAICVRSHHGHSCLGMCEPFDILKELAVDIRRVFNSFIWPCHMKKGIGLIVKIEAAYRKSKASLSYWWVP